MCWKQTTKGPSRLGGRGAPYQGRFGFLTLPPSNAKKPTTREKRNQVVSFIDIGLKTLVNQKGLLGRDTSFFFVLGSQIGGDKWKPHRRTIFFDWLKITRENTSKLHSKLTFTARVRVGSWQTRLTTSTNNNSNDRGNPISPQYRRETTQSG